MVRIKVMSKLQGACNRRRKMWSIWQMNTLQM